MDRTNKKTKESTMKKNRELNNKEIAVLRACEAGPVKLADMAKRFRRAKGDTQAHSWARNSVRKPVRLGLLKKQKRGTYGLTPKGRTFIDTLAPTTRAAA